MKRIFLTGAALVMGSVLAGPVLAADLPQPVEEPVYKEPIPEARFFWTGFYFGGQLGWAWSQFDNTAPVPFSVSTDANGVTGGVYTGYNYQFNENFVLGVEGDFSLSNLDESSTAAGIRLRTSSDWNGNVRARAGFVFDRFMIYGAGGMAIADLSTSYAGQSDDTTKVGWTAGGGIEGAITNNITARVEYLYQDFGDEDFSVGGTTVNTDYSNNIVRFGMAYKF
ncbi:outer membrane beta-barrel protein [Stappia sp. GBMRC 2046]|uniref:Outer membrane beta-barrel protein n=1 Tax=Stappia sediminis TaxID=2692190 RepID=A0A7X3LQT4_9HYPH|nr:outer membrane protein [Stappia sediminis]MXN63381.1 outer membrane beta-barrel protein [Stappia sediminis]